MESVTTEQEMTLEDNRMEAIRLSPEELAQRLGVSRATVYRWRENGNGPQGFRVGKHLRYRLEDVIAWEEAQLAKEAQPAG